MYVSFTIYNVLSNKLTLQPLCSFFCTKVTRTLTNTLCIVHAAKFYCISKRSVENISTEKFTFK
jgi:hypothetical protein